jgi:hypothetical protein
MSKAEKQGLTNGEEQDDGPPLPDFLISTQEEHSLDEKPENEVPPDQHKIGNDTNEDDYTAEQSGYHESTTVDSSMANNQKSANQDRDNHGGGTRLQGQDELEEHIKEGYDFFLVAGIGGVGKNFLLKAFDKVQGTANVDRVSTTMSTALGVIEAFTIDTNFVAGVPNRAFVNISGEDFKLTYPSLQHSRTITQDDIKILKLLASNLRGLVLLFNLNDYWGSTERKEQIDESVKKQVEIIGWFLTVFRWLFNGGTYPENNQHDLGTYIQGTVHKMKGRKTRLNIPVQVLFSKADELRRNKCVVPGTEYALQPRKESPFFLAYHYLPELHEALLRHANYFRYDFARSALPDPDTGVDEINPCGVELSFKWLLTPKSRFRFSTQTLIEIQQFWDKLNGRGERWERYPIPKN